MSFPSRLSSRDGSGRLAETSRSAIRSNHRPRKVWCFEVEARGDTAQPRHASAAGSPDLHFAAARPDAKPVPTFAGRA
jgi:hypothetical protein